MFASCLLSATISLEIAEIEKDDSQAPSDYVVRPTFILLFLECIQVLEAVNMNLPVSNGFNGFSINFAILCIYSHKIHMDECELCVHD